MEQDRTRYLDDSTQASHPGGVSLSHEKLREMRPDLYGLTGAVQSVLGMLRLTVPEKGIIEEALLYGDSRAAVVVSISPLLIAAYTDELDCVALLRFPDAFVQRYQLREGSRLLTVNLYGEDTESGADLVPGPGDSGGWGSFHPIIAEFASDEVASICQRKLQIDEEEWKRAYALGKQYLQQRPGIARDGRPGCSAVPANLVHQIERSIRGEKQRAYLIIGGLGAVATVAVLCSGVLMLARRADQWVFPPADHAMPGPAQGPPPGNLPPQIQQARAEHSRRVAEMEERSRRARDEARRGFDEARTLQKAPPAQSGGGEPRAATTSDAKSSEPRQRTWTDASGQHRTEATLVQYSAVNVTLKRSDGQLLVLPIEKLSVADQEYVRSLDQR